MTIAKPIADLSDDEIRALITENDGAAVYSVDGLFDRYFTMLEADAERAGRDVSTKTQRDKIKSEAFRFTKVKTRLDETGKDLGEEARRRVNAINAKRKDYRERLDALADRTKMPVTLWEKQEQARVEQHQSTLMRLSRAARIEHGATATALAGMIAEIEAIDVSPHELEELAEEGAEKKAAALNALKVAHASTKEAEEARAELARLREAEEKRLAEEAAAKADRERAAMEAAANQRAAAQRLIDHIDRVGMGFIGPDAYPAVLLRRELTEKIAFDEDTFGDLLAEAEAARDVALDRIQKAEDAAQRRRKDEAERQERETREAAAREAARIERAKREAAEEVERRVAAEEAKRREEAAAAERQAAAQEAERAARARDTAHRTEVIASAAADIAKIGNIGPDRARRIAVAIAEGHVHSTTMEF